MLILLAHLRHSLRPVWGHNTVGQSVLRILVALMLLTSIVMANDSTIRVDSFNTLPDSGQSTFRANSRKYWEHEGAQQRGDHFGPFISSGGIHGIAGGLTSAAFATVAYVPERISQTSTAITYAAAQADVCWTILSSDNNGIAGWTRVGTTAYYYQCEGDTTPNQPTLPPNSVWLMQIVIAAGAINTVTELADRRITATETISNARTIGRQAVWTIERGGTIALNAVLTFGGELRAPRVSIFTGTLANLVFAAQHRTAVLYPEWFGVVGDCVTDDSALMTSAFAAASSGRLMVPLAPICYRTGAVEVLIKGPMTLWGYGATFDHITPAATSGLIIGNTTASHAKDVHVYGLTVDLRRGLLDQVSFGSGITVRFGDNVHIRETNVKNTGFQGIGVDRGGSEVYIENNNITRAGGDGIHVGGQTSPDTIKDVYIKENRILDSADGGIGITGGVDGYINNVWVVDNIITGTRGGGGMDIEGAQSIMVRGNRVYGHAKNGILIGTTQVQQPSDIFVESNDIGPSLSVSDWAVNIFRANFGAFVLHPIVIRNNNFFNAGTQAGCVSIAGSHRIDISNNDCLSTAGGTAKGVQLAGDATWPVDDVMIRGNRFTGQQFSIWFANTANNTNIRTYGNEYQNMTALTNISSGPTLHEVMTPSEMVFFRNEALTVTSDVIIEPMVAGRIQSVGANTRVMFQIYRSDAGGGGTGLVELYNVTSSTVLATITVPGGAAAGWQQADDFSFVTALSTLTVRFRRSVAGFGPLTLTSATLSVR